MPNAEDGRGAAVGAGSQAPVCHGVPGQNFGAGGIVTGGANSFTFIQSNSDSHTLTVSTSTDVVAESGYDTYSLTMSGTETYPTAGTISSGSDSFAWVQTASDLLAMTENENGKRCVK